jgi:hypothetical protein
MKTPLESFRLILAEHLQSCNDNLAYSHLKWDEPLRLDTKSQEGLQGPKEYNDGERGPCHEESKKFRS